MNDASSIGSEYTAFGHGPTSSIQHEAPMASDEPAITQGKQRVRRDQRAAMLDHLIRNIDIMIYAQLSILYYMDCSLPYFILRALPHWFYFTPKPSIFPPPTSTHRPYIGIIFGTNALCMLLHLLFTPSAAGEAMRGYLHGGLLIDFVGQKSPVARWKLIGLDLLVLALQILVFGVTSERRAVLAAGGNARNVGEGEQEEVQDHDFEERGVLRQGPNTVENIEMHDMQEDSAWIHGDEGRERVERLQRSSNTEDRSRHPLESFYTGECLIANLHLTETVRIQWQLTGMGSEGTNVPASSVQAAVVAAAAGRTFTNRLNRGLQNNE